MCKMAYRVYANFLRYDTPYLAKSWVFLKDFFLYAQNRAYMMLLGKK